MGSFSQQKHLRLVEEGNVNRVERPAPCIASHLTITPGGGKTEAVEMVFGAGGESSLEGEGILWVASKPAAREEELPQRWRALSGVPATWGELWNPLPRLFVSRCLRNCCTQIHKTMPWDTSDLRSIMLANGDTNLFLCDGELPRLWHGFRHYRP